MGTSVFPTLAGLEYPVEKTPIWSSTLQENVSGKETAIGFFSYPRYELKLSFNFLRSDSTNAELQSLMGFFNLRSGNYDTFLFDDADDDSVTAQAIGTGNGSTAAYQLVRAYGGYVEPILAPHTMTAVYLAGVSIPTAGYSAPTNGALTQTVSGALAGHTYYVRSTWVTNSGETLAATETSLAVSVNNVLNVAHPTGSPPAGAIGWNVYVSISAGTETRQNGATPIAVGAAWVEPDSGLVAGAALPVANTTGWSVSVWGSATPGILTFAGNVVNAIAITATFTFYWPVRFVDQTMSFSKFMNLIWSNKSVILKTVK